MINKNLMLRLSDQRVVLTEPSNLLATLKPNFVRRDLIIILKFPLTDMRRNYQLYKVNTFPMNYASGHAFATEMTGLPKYILTRAKTAMYFELHSPIPDDTILYFPERNHDILRQHSVDNCVTALIKDRPMNVSNNCEWDLLKGNIKPGLLRLNESHIVISKFRI